MLFTVKVLENGEVASLKNTDITVHIKHAQCRNNMIEQTLVTKKNFFKKNQYLFNGPLWMFENTMKTIAWTQHFYATSTN